MLKLFVTITSIVVSFSLGFLAQTQPKSLTKEIVQEIHHLPNLQNQNDMKLGAFSISLSVKDLKISKQFYENIGFVAFGGSMEQNYLIMKNGNALVGLFQGMFQGNILTFNPGWDENAQNIEEFQDVRDIQKHLKSHNINLVAEADESMKGPASIMLNDPDGNMILIDQHR
ncbi:MAG: VOC family protein [Saprospiraceae bacterium]